MPRTFERITAKRHRQRQRQRSCVARTEPSGGSPHRLAGTLKLREPFAMNPREGEPG